MKSVTLRLAFLCGVLLVSASVASAAKSVASAATIVNQGWQPFECIGIPSNPEVFSLDLRTTTGLTEVRIVDAFTGGDVYQVVVRNQTEGTSFTLFTSQVPQTEAPEYIPDYYPAQVWNDPDAAWTLEKYFSRLSISLSPGLYEIDITLAQSAIGSPVDPSPGQAMNDAMGYLQAINSGTALDTRVVPTGHLGARSIGPVKSGAKARLKVNSAPVDLPKSTTNH